jgi:guanylate kinase
MLAQDENLALSVSFTTRAPRAGEENGRDYHFVERAEFEARRADNEFLEWAEVHGNLYGTSRRWIEVEMRGGRDIVFEIDCQGAAAIKRLFPDAVRVFILPPSRAELARRLRARGTDGDAEIERRMANADEEMRRAAEFDYAIINATFSEALEQLRAVVIAARARVKKAAERYPQAFREMGIPLP